jgi:hypothetical protein
VTADTLKSCSYHHLNSRAAPCRHFGPGGSFESITGVLALRNTLPRHSHRPYSPSAMSLPCPLSSSAVCGPPAFPAPNYTQIVVDDHDPAVTYSGRWTSTGLPGWEYDGTLSYSGQGGTGLFGFTGTVCTFIALKARTYCDLRLQGPQCHFLEPRLCPGATAISRTRSTTTRRL